MLSYLVMFRTQFLTLDIFSLIIRYNQMRADPKLCFLSRCGPPDATDYSEDGKHEKGSFEQDDSKLDFDEDR